MCHNGATTSGARRTLLVFFLYASQSSATNDSGGMQAFVPRACQPACDCRATCGWCLRAPTDDMLDSHVHRHRPERCCILLGPAKPSHAEAQLQSSQLAVRSLSSALCTRLLWQLIHLKPFLPWMFQLLSLCSVHSSSHGLLHFGYPCLVYDTTRKQAVTKCLG